MGLFFVDKKAIVENEIHITGIDVNHIKNVLRMKEGDEARISDSQYFYTAKIISLSKEEVILKSLNKTKINTELPVHISLFQGLPKQDKMDMICMKNVELGVCEIIPFMASRTVVKLDNTKSEKKQKRWQQIAEGAAKQSNRGVIPQIRKVATFSEAINMAQEADVILCPYERAQGISATRAVMSQIKTPQKIAVFVGPEGGFEESEVASLREVGAKIITLGNRILRTETAGMYMLSVLSYLTEGQ